MEISQCLSYIMLMNYLISPLSYLRYDHYIKNDTFHFVRMKKNLKREKRGKIQKLAAYENLKIGHGQAVQKLDGDKNSPKKKLMKFRVVESIEAPNF